jgi:hypothetical protein
MRWRRLAMLVVTAAGPAPGNFGFQNFPNSAIFQKAWVGLLCPRPGRTKCRSFLMGLREDFAARSWPNCYAVENGQGSGGEVRGVVAVVVADGGKGLLDAFQLYLPTCPVLACGNRHNSRRTCSTSVGVSMSTGIQNELS